MSAKPETRAQAASERRDARSSPEPEAGHSPGSRRKNRKRWCKGRPERAHTPVCLTYAEVKPVGPLCDERFTSRWRILVCSTCGKHLAYYYPMCKPEPIPSWVTK
jgi:hypothetical protein